MKPIQIFATLILIFFVFGGLTAQSEENNRPEGFGGVSFINTTLAGKWTLEAGGMGASFLNQNIYVGGGGFGLSQTKDGYEYGMGYGGVMLGYLWGGQNSPSVNFYVFGGYGGVAEKIETTKHKDDFWVVRPSVEVDFRIAKWMRIGVGGGYRWVTGSDIALLNDADLSASFGSITLRFGN